MFRLLCGPTHIHTWKTIDLTIQTFVGKVTSLLFNTLSRFVIAFLPRSRRLLISWLQSPSPVILEHKKMKSVTKILSWPLVLNQHHLLSSPFIPFFSQHWSLDISTYLWSVCSVESTFFVYWNHAWLVYTQKKYEWMNSCAWLLSWSLICSCWEGNAFIFKSVNKNRTEAWALAQEHRGWTTDPDWKWMWKSSLGLRKDIRAPAVEGTQQFGLINWWNTCF